MSRCGAGKNFIDLVDSVRFIPGTLARQRLRNFRLVFRKIVLKNFRKIVRKVLRVQIVVELFSQEIFQRFKSARSDQTPFQAAPPQDLPLQGHHVGYEHLLDNIDRLYRCADTGEKLVIGGGVFALKQLWLTKQRQPRRCGAGVVDLDFDLVLGSKRSRFLGSHAYAQSPWTLSYSRLGTSLSFSPRISKSLSTDNRKRGNGERQDGEGMVRPLRERAAQQRRSDRRLAATGYSARGSSADFATSLMHERIIEFRGAPRDPPSRAPADH